LTLIPAARNSDASVHCTENKNARRSPEKDAGYVLCQRENTKTVHTKRATTLYKSMFTTIEKANPSFWLDQLALFEIAISINELGQT
jgi:hypothetical protein